MTSWQFPKIYPILDSSVIPNEGRNAFLTRLGRTLAEAGVTLLEYRNKSGSEAQVLNDATILRSAMPGPQIRLILDDRADLIDRLGFDGVHVDADDVSPREARRLLGPGKIVGTFGGCEALIPGVLNEPVDYWSIGPVFATTTKETSKPLIGIEGVRRLRAEAGSEPRLVAAAGISLESAGKVLAAGATTVAVAGALFRTADPAAEFRRWKSALG